MNLQEYLEQDKERLISSLKQAGTAERAIPLIESEYDRLLYEYNEQCEDDYERRCAAMMLQTARMAAQMIDCVGETKIWEQGGKLLTDEKKKVRLPAILLLIAGLLLSVASAAVLAGADVALDRVYAMPAIAAGFVAGLVCLFFAGFFFRKTLPAKFSDKQLMAEHKIDAEKIYTSMHSILLIADRNIRDAMAAKAAETQQKDKNNEAYRDTSDLALYSDLLEASMAKDPEYALDQLSKVPFYLHQKGIEAVNYSEEYRNWFDVIPGEKRETIRPALIKDGRLLKKGIVSGDRL